MDEYDGEMMNPKDDEGPLFFRDGIVYREWGYKLVNNENYPKAERYFERAIEHGQLNDLRTYLGMCKTQLKYARYNRAVVTTNKCLEIDPTYTHVKHVQLETLFHIGEFEHSLVHAHLGFQKHPSAMMEQGIQQANQTIEDCIGTNTVHNALDQLSPWIEELEDYRKLMTEKLNEEVDELAGIEEEQSRFKVNDSNTRQEVRYRKLQRICGQIYLGYLARDKEFLQMLHEEPDRLVSPNKHSNDLLYPLVMRNFRRTLRRQNILRMRRPLYVRIFNRRLIPLGHKQMIEEEQNLKRNLTIIHADFLLRKLHKMRMKKDYITFFGMVDRIVEKFDTYTLKMFPEKQKCLDMVYNMVAWAYIDTRDLTNIRSKRLRKIYLKHQLGIRVAELPRDSDIAWIRPTDRKTALTTFRKRLALAKAPLELAWIFHELCKHLIDIRRYDLARFYGKKARDMGQEAGSEQWMLNSQHLFIRIEISQNYRTEAKEAALLALSSSKKLGIDFLVEFYRSVIEIIEEMDMEKILDFDAIAVRQQLILNLMPDDMKTEVDFLWRRMDAVPAKRRLSVMPGCKPVDRKFKLPCKRQTITPHLSKNPEKEARKALLLLYEPSKERPGFVNFDEFD